MHILVIAHFCLFFNLSFLKLSSWLFWEKSMPLEGR